jgi:hypothetical protein
VAGVPWANSLGFQSLDNGVHVGRLPHMLDSEGNKGPIDHDHDSRGGLDGRTPRPICRPLLSVAGSTPSMPVVPSHPIATRDGTSGSQAIPLHTPPKGGARIAMCRHVAVGDQQAELFFLLCAGLAHQEG